MTSPDRPSLAAEYWRSIDEAAAAWWVDHPDDLSGGPVVADLCTEAILAGVSATLVPVGDGVSVPLHDLIAMYRTRPGGRTELAEQEKSHRLHTPYGGKKWSEGW